MSIRDDRDRARHSLGWCPQFPRLWDDLTVEDHLSLFVTLRGLPSPYSPDPAVRAEGRRGVRILADGMQLGGATLKKAARALSGGMKRRLSLAISVRHSELLDPVQRKHHGTLLYTWRLYVAMPIRNLRNHFT